LELIRFLRQKVKKTQGGISVMVSLVQPKKIEKKLKEEAEKKGISEEEIIVEAISKALDEPLDPDELVEVHLKLLEKYMNEAEDFLKKGDYVQASEKVWKAAAQAVKALAAKDGREIRSHRELNEEVSRISRETGDDEIRALWQSATALHQNFYENRLPPDMVEGNIRDLTFSTAKAGRFPVCQPEASSYRVQGCVKTRA
jgi:HEPN domain-containing protein